MLIITLANARIILIVAITADTTGINQTPIQTRNTTSTFGPINITLASIARGSASITNWITAIIVVRITTITVRSHSV